MKKLPFLMTVLLPALLLCACHHGVTIHPSRVTPEMKREYAKEMSGLYDTRVHVISSIAGKERVVKIENGKRVEYFESQDSTLQLKATILDYDNGMKLILHNFPLSTIATALPDSLGMLRAAIANLPDQELTASYDFVYNDQLQLHFVPQELPFTCQTPDGRQHHLRLCLDCKTYCPLGKLEEKVLNVNLILNNQSMVLTASTLYEDESPLINFDEWQSNDFFNVTVRFTGRS